MRHRNLWLRTDKSGVAQDPQQLSDSKELLDRLKADRSSLDQAIRHLETVQRMRRRRPSVIGFATSQET